MKKFLMIALFCLISFGCSSEETYINTTDEVEIGEQFDYELEFRLDNGVRSYIAFTHDGNLEFVIAGVNFVEMRKNGDIYVQGRPADSDKEFVDEFKKWFAETLEISSEE